ncbi:hypothetical protein JX266_011298 [Neoarthrinium moseri]|nr:hypothetical protein JX266_011298 [Neoarthrinium moseri]
MLLLNAQSLKLMEFVGQTPRYAILSHVWEEQEVTLDDLRLSRYVAESRRGYPKIQNACAQALKCGLSYIWIDTCCIDKSSSAELSEAINSMFRWYQESAVCFAFLADVSAVDDIGQDDSEFSRSRWFTRGWTLQELLAPEHVQFMSKSWSELGTKVSLSTYLTKITSIDKDYLNGEDLGTASIAHRMSWASRRATTRLEDMAYCLLGIFDIHMPLIYGEGIKAFRRLQEEILKDTTDESIFAWWRADDSANEGPNGRLGGSTIPGACGILAQSPSDFAFSANIIPWRARDDQPCVVSSNAIQLTSYRHGTAMLQCRDRLDPGRRIYIPLSRFMNTEQFFRAGPGPPDYIHPWQVEPITVGRVQVMKDRPRRRHRQAASFHVMLPVAAFSPIVRIGDVTGSNFIWEDKTCGLRRETAGIPFIVRVSLHVGGGDAYRLALWLLAWSKWEFKLDYVALTPHGDTVEFDNGTPGRIAGSSHHAAPRHITDRSKPGYIVNVRDSTYIDTSRFNHTRFGGTVQKELSPTGNSLYIIWVTMDVDLLSMGPLLEDVTGKGSSRRLGKVRDWFSA